MKTRLAVFFSISLLFLTASLAQQITPINSTGVEPIYAYKGGLNESVNSYSGNLNVSVPVLTLKGRAGLDVAIVLSYDLRQLRWWADPYNGEMSDWNYTGRIMGRWVPTFYPYVREWNWAGGGNYWWHADVTFVEGTQNHLDTGGYRPPPTKGIGKSTNAADMQYNFDTKVLTMKDGSWYDFSRSTEVWKGDANGNYIRYIHDGTGKTTQIVDTLGRSVNIYYENPTDNQLPSRITVLNNAGATLTYTFEYLFKLVETSYFSGNKPFLTRINLPDGKFWGFTYNGAGSRDETLQLSRVDYPVGGYTRYTYLRGAGDMYYRLSQKIVNANSGQGEITTSYAYSNCLFGSCSQDPSRWAKTNEPDGSFEYTDFSSNALEFRHRFYNSGGASVRAESISFNGNRRSGLATYASDNFSAPYVSNKSWQYDGAGNVTLDETTAPSSAGQTFRGRRVTRAYQSFPETVWVDDSVPSGATSYPDVDGWNWVNSNPTPVTGISSHQSALLGGTHQHYFAGATATITPGTGEKLFVYVYIDPANPPQEVMLQWNDGNWEHRAFWGDDLIPWGQLGTASRAFMGGSLPPLGEWARLEVPASVVGLEGRTVNGMAFTLYGGRASWDRAGKAPAAFNGYRLVEESAYDLDQSLNTSLVSKTGISYDQFALTNRTGAANHDDANYGTGFASRGNQTTVSKWLASESRWLDTKWYYDILGNVVQMTDTRNYSTTINYSSSFHYAYPTQVINAKGQTINANYSFYTGQMTSQTNENNFTTSVTYDSLNRVTRVDSPDTSYFAVQKGALANPF